jgi:alanyl-tRNA synthetase
LEKYGDTVRAIKFGESMELCGGIHVKKRLKSGISKFL